MSDYGDIIARLEKATGADRELDAVIMCAIGGARRIDEFTFYGPGEKTWGFGEHGDEAWNGALPYVTASLDASLALVVEKLPGDRIVGVTEARTADVEAHSAVITIPGPAAWQSFSASAPNAPLAVLLALFRALQTTSNKAP